jgi:sigma-B regulation protein RsbU (phosphoserine phosphatase)
VPLFYGILDTYNHTFTYTNSIGNAGGILLSNNTFKELDKGGFAIGGTEDTDYEEETIPLQKNDNIILFTDGIVEQRNTANKQFGQKRLTDILLKNKNNKNILTNIQKEIESYMHNWQQEDDITMINIACTA